MQISDFFPATSSRSAWPRWFSTALAVLVAFAAWGWSAEPSAPFSAAQLEFFEKRIRPVLVERCYACHAAEAKEIKGGFRLDSRPGLLAGGESGPAVVVGKAGESLLLQALRHEGLKMPPAGKLPEAVIADFAAWIDGGLADPRDVVRPRAASGPDLAAARAHWAFRPLADPPPPAVRQKGWPQAPHDRFILARLEEAGLSPGPAADRRSLLRRLSYDLVGLPPSYEETQAFERDASPTAVAGAVDRLLAAPGFGERWARHWLDLARFADTKGYVFMEDRAFPHAYRYRDWVIRAFAEDLPYDEFLRRQIAADQIVPADQPDELAALGFLTLGRRFINNKHDIIDDRIDVLCRTTLGLTVACARCHDHKYDPFTMADYYGLYGVFASSKEVQDGNLPLRLVDAPQPVTPRIFLRGNPGNPGPETARRFLAAFEAEPPQAFTRGSGRLELAQRVTAADNPLVARVWVNRVWGHLFGRGLVVSPSDFGLRSDPPTHPELLDHLARTFIADGWSTKRLIRRLVLSAVYHAGSVGSEPAKRIDPENRLLAHGRRRRLDFEALRDTLLSISGELETSPVGGPSVDITKPPFPRRRTLYAYLDRQNLPNLFRTFDFASPDTHFPQRYETTVPQQALYLMNSPFLLELAEKLAARLEEGGGDAADQVRRLYRRALARDPDPEELAWCVSFLSEAGPREEVAAAVWQYGFGEVDVAAGRLKSFTPLPHFTGQAWQGGPQLPDPRLGWCILNAGGGHPGNDSQHAVARRFIAPRGGRLTIAGLLKHPEAQGNGVVGRVLSSRQGALGEWTAAHGQAETPVAEREIQQGETLDFVVDHRGDVSFDSFQWTVRLRLVSAGEVTEYDSAREFRGTVSGGLRPLARLAQTLLLSNEVAYLD